MKRLFHTLLTVTAMMTLVASCVKEPASVADPALGGTPVPVTFNLDLGFTLSKADTPVSTALDDGTAVNKVFAAVFSSDGSLISTSKIGGTGYDATASMSGGKASITITLSKGQDYKVVFFVQKDDTYVLNFADGNRATFSYKKDFKANDPALDAFWATVDVKSSVTSYNVTLKRPFAQVNVLVPADNVPAGKEAFSSAMTVKAAPASFDLFSGKAGADRADLVFADNAISAPAFGKYAPKDGVAAYRWVGMNFVLVPDSGKLDFAFKEKDMARELALSAIPVRMNGRTNLVGSLYEAEDVNGSFSVWIDSGIGGGGEQNTDAEETVITIADGSTYTAEKPLVIDASASPMTTVRLRVNGHSFSEVLAGAKDGAITAVSANTAVATAKVDGEDVVITPVGNGETVITVNTPAYTKTDYQGGSFKIPVKVTGVSEEKKTPVISVTDPADKKLELEVGETADIVAKVLDGETAVEGLAVSYASSDAEVATVDKDGLVTAVKAGKATITLTTEANAGYNAAEPVTIAVTVTDEDEPGGDDPGDEDEFFVKVTGAQTDWSGEYLIVYEDGKLAFDGGLEKLDVAKNTIAVEIVDGKIAATGKTKAAVFTIASMEGGYSIKSAHGEYIGNTKQLSGAPANGLTPGTEALVNTITFSDGTPLIVSNTTELKYNKTSGDERFRYYKSGNKQQAVALYKLGGGEEGGEEGGDDPGEGDTPVTATLTVTPESLTLEVGTGGTLTVETNSSATPTFTSDKESVATVDAEGRVTAVAEGKAAITVAVAAVEGKFTAASKTVSVTVTQAGATPYKRVTAIKSGEKYILVGLKASKYYAATPLASDKTYGRLNGYEITVSNDEITEDLANYEFTFTSSGDGYTIAMPDGRQLAVDSKYDGTFQINDNLDHVFTASQADGLFTIVHQATGRTIYHGGGTYTNFSCASKVADDGTLIMLFSKVQGEPSSADASVATGSASSLTKDGATLSGSYSGVSATAEVREAGFAWGISSTPSSWNPEDVILSQDDVLGKNRTSGSFSVALDGLGNDRTYYYRAYIAVLDGSDLRYYYGAVRSFKTLADEEKPSPVPRWYESPTMNVTVSGDYMIDSSDSDIYYAYHMTDVNGPGGKEARNYTVAFSAKHHCPLWVAAPRHKMYVGNSGRTEAYKADPDIPASIQYKSKSTGGGCNKGHMLGSAERTVSKSTNSQVFYYSNIAPQLSSGFNTGGGGWNKMEDWVDGQVCNDTLYVVIGCYFDTYTDGYGYTVNPSKISFGGRTDVSMPTMFYYLLIRTKNGSSGKALKDCTADEIQCAAFVRSHTNSLKGQAVTKKDMISVSDLERVTGFTYFPNVPNAPKDTFNPADWGL